ncbi:hypothetical protein [Roseicella aerolata]|uniref:Uncharacterized protein n=1 Tax=Roseicella aerolata TaxID=2883479 RepID=A0A9X1LC48_9PROT|nr:hypothetical protein [Roseicella aerolata]MCB4823763.1 hypothetical protein [Roseicella aerolata]
MDEEAGLHPRGAWREAPAQDPVQGSAGLLRALPEGWAMLGRCRTGAAGPASYPTGCYALAHPTTGIALVDVAPDVTPNAEARLRRALGAANFWPAFPGYLPVWHGRIELAAWRSLPGIMAEGFSELPPLTVPGRGAWIAAARSALAEDGAWEVPGAAPRGPRPLVPVAVPLDEEEDAAPPRRPWRGRLGLVLGFAATFALGLASGMALLSGEAPPSGPASAGLATMPAPLPVAMPTATPSPPGEAIRPEQAMAAPEPAVSPPPPAPQPVIEAAVPPPAAAPASAEAQDAAGADPIEPAEAVPDELPLPPEAPKAPVQRASQPRERIDRACSQALYRYQLGQPLTAAEAAYLRDGCVTRR